MQPATVAVTATPTLRDAAQLTVFLSKPSVAYHRRLPRVTWAPLPARPSRSTSSPSLAIGAGLRLSGLVVADDQESVTCGPSIPASGDGLRHAKPALVPTFTGTSTSPSTAYPSKLSRRSGRANGLTRSVAKRPGTRRDSPRYLLRA